VGRPRLTPYLLLAAIVLGSGLGVGLGLSESHGPPALPTSTAFVDSLLGPRSTATLSAKAILFNLNHGNLEETVPPHPCSVVEYGVIGPLKGPLKTCAISTAEGHIVIFTALSGSPPYGITYTDRWQATLLDECYMHLTGRWWAWRWANLSDPAGPCPSPWRFHGGP
jgi:hypothetical protein